MKQFNITGKCNPEKHYMVDMKDRLSSIKKMISNGDYFCINRGRQYGKTTTLNLLWEYLSSDYSVYMISFEGLGDEIFESFDSLAYTFLKKIEKAARAKRNTQINDSIKLLLKNKVENYQFVRKFGSNELSDLFSELCDQSDKPVVLMIDEVDQASGCKSFIDFLGLLRDMYLQREDYSTFQSVILAGVYDIKNLKLKLRPEEEHKYNSPWNIAAPFHIKMSFSKEDIEKMLLEYENDHKVGMDINAISKMIYDYTSGYPFLVSKLCKTIDEEIKDWTKSGLELSVNRLLGESNTMFDDMVKKLNDFKQLRDMLYEILYHGRNVPFNIYNSAINIASAFNYIVEDGGKVKVSNRIFETWLYNLFVSEERLNNEMYDAGSIDKNQFVTNGHLDMERVLSRFVEHYNDVYGDRNEKFHEKEGRKFFIFYLKPIINGIGHYYIESETRDETRTDIIVDYLGEQFVIELKIWRGNAYNERGEKQLIEYLDYFHVDKGYMLSFNFNKKKQIGVKNISFDDKLIVEAVV